MRVSYPGSCPPVEAAGRCCCCHRCCRHMLSRCLRQDQRVAAPPSGMNVTGSAAPGHQANRCKGVSEDGVSEDGVSVIPAVTVAQMREVDQIMVDELHIELLQMMENAGRCLAAHTRSWLGGQLTGRRVVVLAGGGGNGGGGLVAARRLTIWGAAAAVVLGQPRSAVRGVPARQLEILDRM